MSLLSITLILFLIMDPIGSVSPYLKMVKNVPSKRQSWLITREMLIALAVMIVFHYLGESIFSLLEISDITVRLSSGVILFLFSVKILFPSLNNPRSRLPKGEPFIIPIAIPFIAGPSLLATIMLFAQLETSHSLMMTAILIAWFASFLVLLAAPVLQRILGDNGLIACERLMGMILVLLAIQRFMEGVREFVVTYVTL